LKNQIKNSLKGLFHLNSVLISRNLVFFPHLVSINPEESAKILKNNGFLGFRSNRELYRHISETCDNWRFCHSSLKKRLIKRWCLHRKRHF